MNGETHSEARLMKRKFSFLIVLIFFFSLWTAYPQFLPQEIAQREAIEEFLSTADIIKAEDIGEGVTKPKRLYLKKGDKETSGVWKNIEGKRLGNQEGWQYEIAAYRFDKLLDLNMIPPTVEREFDGEKGSLQLWVTTPYSLLTIMEENIPMPTTGAAAVRINRAKYIVRAFDSLIGNADRTQQNLRYTEDWRTILIDHSQSFQSAKKYTKHLMYGKEGIKEVKLIRSLPRSFVEKVKALNFDKIKNAVGPYLTDKEIKAVLSRREVLLKEIEDMISEQGEDKVLYGTMEK
jgi:hypothetical protein